jgi:sortase (surface protein transpeptidase)
VVVGFVFGVVGLTGLPSASGTPAAGEAASSEAAPTASATWTPAERIATPSLETLIAHSSAPGEATTTVADQPDPAERPEPADADGTAADASHPDPMRVIVPAIAVDAELVPLGLQPDHAMELPEFGTAGWYELGPKPGEDGPAVIAAHLDDQEGPDVFYELEQLAPGDEIHVALADGTHASFVVEDMEFTRKEALPVERIWAPTDGPGLRLITCGGTFNRWTGHYESNLIVYATAAG